MIINFLIFLPYLLLVAIGLAYSHHWMREHPFQVTFGVLGLAAAWILLFPLAVPIFRIAAYNRSVETGSESTVKQRDLYERSFGALLLAALAAAAFEFLPWALEFFHDRLQLAGLGWKGGLATASAGLALLGGANRLLSALDGVKQKAAMVLVGILGLLVPLIVILSATDYLLYGLPPSLLWMLSPLAVSVVGVVGITIGILLGLRRKAFRTSEVFAVLGLLALGVALAVTVVALSALALVKGFERGDDHGADPPAARGDGRSVRERHRQAGHDPGGRRPDRRIRERETQLNGHDRRARDARRGTRRHAGRR